MAYDASLQLKLTYFMKLVIIFQNFESIERENCFRKESESSFSSINNSLLHNDSKLDLLKEIQV